MSNLGNVSAQEARNMNPLVLLQYKAVVFVDPVESLKMFDTKKREEGERTEEKPAKAPAKETKSKAKAPAKAKKTKVTA